ncbi:MAG: hypothetical protein QOE09_2518, partial [Ilumatobacteraceae bacterium]
MPQKRRDIELVERRQVAAHCIAPELRAQIVAEESGSLAHDVV